MNDKTEHEYIKIVSKDIHKGEICLNDLESHTENFSKPVLFKGMVNIDEKLCARHFYDQIDPEKTLQWRIKSDDHPVSMRAPDGTSDYNYVTGKVGAGREFLDDIFVKKLDVYSHLGTISSGFDDPYEWGKIAFGLVKDEVFRAEWLKVDNWKITGQIFLGNSTTNYGEPRCGSVGSDWHMFPTLNIFVMIGGKKKWMTRPPEPGDQYRNYNELFSTSSGREAPGKDFDCDVVSVVPGDVLLNPPYEWHKVLNAEGFSLGAGFRVIDTDYLLRLGSRDRLDVNKVDITAGASYDEDLAHLLTSASYASRHINRAQMMLNDIEYSYLRKRRV